MLISRTKKLLLMGLGFISLALGIIGILLPLLPTTVFLLISAWAWMKSSERFYTWLITSRILGSYIRNYREEKGMSSGQKVFTLAVLWVGIGSTALFVVSKLWLSLLLVAIAAGVTVHLLTLKTLRVEERSR